MLVMCAENVLRLASIDCSSPMSANTRPEHRQLRALRGGNPQPACAISASSPAVFSATVLPPVFGPVMTQHAVAGGIDRASSTGTALAGQQRMPRRRQLEAAVRRQRRFDAVDSIENRARGLQHVELGRGVDRPLQVAGAARGTRRSAPAGSGAPPRPPAARARRCRC